MALFACPRWGVVCFHSDLATLVTFALYPTGFDPDQSMTVSRHVHNVTRDGDMLTRTRFAAWL